VSPIAGGAAAARANLSAVDTSGSTQGEHAIVNPLGLHARAASKLVALANKFDAEVFVAKGDTEVNGKSILGVLMLACPMGATIGLRTEGREAAAAYAALAALVDAGFGEL
jgi:phosphocarrier protein